MTLKLNQSTCIASHCAFNSQKNMWEMTIGYLIGLLVERTVSLHDVVLVGVEARLGGEMMGCPNSRVLHKGTPCMCSSENVENPTLKVLSVFALF